MGNKLADLLAELRAEPIHTWFDLGLFVDRVKEKGKTPAARIDSSFEGFKEQLKDGGLAFITFTYGVDGVTVEVAKYAHVFRQIVADIPIHFVAGDIHTEADRFIEPDFLQHEIPEIRGFGAWPLYRRFFFTKLQRGDRAYNRLIHDFWADILSITEKLGQCIEDHNINLLFPINVCSNPGNVSLSFALVLLSEYLGIPVINNNHDFYWEGGTSKFETPSKGRKSGPRDFFYRNVHIGEFFSLIEMLYPWESRLWVAANINRSQCKHLVEVKGHNPANVYKVSTAVDTARFMTVTRRDNIETSVQVKTMLSHYQEKLPVYTPTQALENAAKWDKSPEPMLIGAKNLPDFKFRNTMIFLQPTRIMQRKRIDIGFKLIGRLFENETCNQIFERDRELSITMIVTGPISMGHTQYFMSLVEDFDAALSQLPPEYSSSVFLGFLFSEFDKPRFKERYERPVGIPELYSAASLILLPSETEGRGLPIIEASACGRPIFCRRYYPENVYAEVIGEHLPEMERLKVMEYRGGGTISDSRVQKIANRIFFPQQYAEEIRHNQQVIETRYSLKALERNFQNILRMLHHQLRSNAPNLNRAARALKAYRQKIQSPSPDLKCLVDGANREYMPGVARSGFMCYLKSLIDPSFFRVEEQQIRGYVMRFASRLVNECPQQESSHSWQERTARFYNTVDSLFLHSEGEIKTRHDHAFSYRHRNKLHYPYRDLTHQELTGVMNWLFNKMIASIPTHKLQASSNFFTDWRLALLQLTNSSVLAIDDRELLMQRLHSNVEDNVPVAYFPGQYIKYELEFFVLQSIRARLKLKLSEQVTPELIKANKTSLSPIYIFCRESPFGSYVTYEPLQQFIETAFNPELRLLIQQEICRIIPTEQLSVGLHLGELGSEALKILRDIKKNKGFLIAHGQYAAIMTDSLDMDRFHIGEASNPLVASMMGLPLNSGFVQFVPAGIRPTLAYPTPIQTARDLSEALQSDQFKRLSEKLGQRELLGLLGKEAGDKGQPIGEALDRIEQDKEGSKSQTAVTYSRLSGIYKDGLPWSGILAKANLNSSTKKWAFSALSAGTTTETVNSFVSEFEKAHNVQVKIAWNGGYILNPELVGKLGLPESCIGAPLGLIISSGKILSPPLFNKPALLIYSNGKIDIKRVNCRKGITFSDGVNQLSFSSTAYNSDASGEKLAFYDLMYEQEKIPGQGRVILQLIGSRIHSITFTKKGQQVSRIPVGLTLAIPESSCPKEWTEKDRELQISLNGLEDIECAIEAGPLLVQKERNCINMAQEGWNTSNSINTQAARLDFLDMRGPKIAVGLDCQQNLYVLTVNGRIRESVGATHRDMADILIEAGIHKAMGFDPGGSATLVANGKTLNISPYNKDYEYNIYSLPPEARAVSNAIVGWQE